MSDDEFDFDESKVLASFLGSSDQRPLPTEEEELIDLGLEEVTLKPPKTILKPLVMSIHTFQAQLKNLQIPFRELFERLKGTLNTNDNVYALHCNFGHAVKF